MKRNELLFAALQVPLDYLAVLCAGWIAYGVRFHQVASIFPVTTTTLLSDFLRLVAMVGWVWIVGLALQGAYAIRQRSLAQELGRVAMGASFAILLLIVFIFFRREFVASRFIVVTGWLLSVIMLWISHIVARSLQRYLQSRGWNATRVIFVGNDQTTQTLSQALRVHRSMGLQVVKVLPEVTATTIEQLHALAKVHAVDEVWQTDPTLPKQQSLAVLEACTESSIGFQYAADLFATETGHVTISDIAGIPMIEIRRTTLDGWGRILKRALDLVGASLIFLLMLIPGLLVALAIKLDSAGPIFIRLERVGQGQRRFYLWKFRSMIKDAHAMKAQLMAQNERGDGPLFKMERDPRITRVGRFIRKTSLDEFPQLFNVFAGSMSLVGPRPHEPEEVARYDKHHKKLLTIKPGMTGMAQVSGRSNLSFEEEVRLDTFYIEHWSLGLDFQILLRTPLAVINTKTAA
jgi:exopolysaccharide biosynthesis polyprenyl glycosylphosphotransferase